MKKQASSKDRKDSPPKALQCYLQRSSPGGIMLMELVFQVGSVYGTKLCSVSTGSDDRVRLCSVVVGRVRFLSVDSVVVGRAR